MVEEKDKNSHLLKRCCFPMNGTLGLTQLVMSTELTPVQNDYLQKINSSSKNLLTIINDILDVSKIEAGKIDIVQIKFKLEKVLEDVSVIFPEFRPLGSFSTQ